MKLHKKKEKFYRASYASTLQVCSKIALGQECKFRHRNRFRNITYAGNRFPYFKQYSVHILLLFVLAWSPSSKQYSLVSMSCAACYASCWPKMTIDCSATAFVIRLEWILHLNHFIIYVPNSCWCHLEAVWLVIHHTLSFTVVINIVMGWTFTMKLLVVRECRSLLGQGLKTGFNRRKDYQVCLLPDRLSRGVVSSPSHSY